MRIVLTFVACLFAAPGLAQTSYLLTADTGIPGETTRRICLNAAPCVDVPLASPSTLVSLPDGEHVVVFQSCTSSHCEASEPLFFTVSSSTPPPTLLDWQFPLSTSPKFAGSTWMPGLGWDGSAGHIALIGALNTAQSFPSVTAGVVRFDWAYRVPDSDTAANNSKDFQLYLLPATGTVTSNNSAVVIAIVRDTTYGANASQVAVRTRNGAAAVTLTMASRNVWHSLSALVDFSTKTAQILHDGVSVGTVAWANASLTDLSRVGVLTFSGLPESSIDGVVVWVP